MAKLSGLIGSGKVGKADQTVVDAMPDAPSIALDSSIPLKSKNGSATSPMLDSSAALSVGVKPVVLASGAPRPTVTELDISMIRPSPYQVRSIADSDYIESLMSSIIHSGVISPVVVRMLDSSAYEIIAGHHRLEACRRLSYAKLPVVVRQMTDAEAACALTSDNFVRKELSDFERYKHAKLLKDHQFCKTNSEIGQVLGVSRQLVGFLFAFDDYPVRAKAILEVNPKILGATQAYELKDLAKEEPDVFADAIALLGENRLRQNQIRGWVDSRLKSSSLQLRPRREIRIFKPGFPSAIRLTYTEREAKIQADGLNIEKLQKLLEDNLEHLVAK
jgi:ParB family chromosome partitioning protein